MRIVFFGNNWTAWQSMLVLRRHGAEIAAVVLNDPPQRQYTREIVEVAGVAEDLVFAAADLATPGVRETLASLEPELGLCVFFSHLLGSEVLGLFPRPCLNLHPSLLPWNRGGYPNVWCLVDGTPAGVTLHEIDEGVDTGPIVAQQNVPARVDDTGESLYRRLERACVELLDACWPDFVAGDIETRPQADGGSVHRDGDVETIDEIHLDAVYRAGDLIDILRARTFPPHRGAYFVHAGRRIYLELSLREESVECVSPAVTSSR